MERLDFSSLTILEVEVAAPDGVTYILREANGKTAKEHRDAIMSSTRFDANGKAVGLTGLAGVEAAFVSGCMWRVAEDGEVTKAHPQIDLIESWPARVQKQLYEKAKELSGVKEKDSPAIKALKEALKRSDSPVSYDLFAEWASGLSDDKFKPLSQPFSEEEKGNEVKN